MQREINLRSDTCTLPTDSMREAMGLATVGDDVYGEDPTIRELERIAAEKVGKPASLFVPSGTMGNLIALMTHCNHGEEVILEADSHIMYYEVGGLSSVAGLCPRVVRGRHGIMDPSDIEKALRDDNIHYPRTSILCLESPHNRGGGTVIPLEVMKASEEVARKHGLRVHLDGARIFNAALHLEVDASVIASFADSVMFCLSKGLSAPVGSVLCGDREFIAKARKIRKLLGGGMRQAGVIAAAGIVALKEMISRLAEDHDNAQRLGKHLAQIPGIELDLSTVQTNMVEYSIAGLGISSSEFAQRLQKHGVRCSTRPPCQIRMVTHRHIDANDVDGAVEAVVKVVDEIRRSGGR
jgi:threonine aldolase